MTRSKTPFDQSRAWPDPTDQGAEHAGSHDPHLAWPHQQPAYDPRGYAGQQSGGAGQHTFDRSAAPPQYYPQQDYPPQETPLQGHYDQYGGHAAGYGQQAGGYEPPSGGSHQPDPLTADPHGQFYHQPGQHPAPGGYAYQDYNTPPTQPPSAQQGGFGSHDSYVAAQLRPATHERSPIRKVVSLLAIPRAMTSAATCRRASLPPDARHSVNPDINRVRIGRMEVLVNPAMRPVTRIPIYQVGSMAMIRASKGLISMASNSRRAPDTASRCRLVL